MTSRADIEELRRKVASIESRSSGAPGPAALGSTGSRRSTAARRPSSAPTGESEKALKRIIALVNASDRSSAAVEDRLVREGFSGDAVEEAIERARSCGLLDDMRYACVLIRSRLSQGRGIAGIERELEKHSISLADVPGWPEEFDYLQEDETDRALSYLRRHPSRSKDKRTGAYRKLIQKGYSSSTASEAARRWADGR